MTARRTRARRGEGDRLRAEILTAAERLLVARGSEEAVSVREIAGAVGCSPPSIYLHFADKAELFFEVCRARFEELDAYIEDAVAGIDDPVAALRARLGAYVRYGLTNPEAYRVLFMATPHQKPDHLGAEDLPGRAALDRLVANIQEIMDAGIGVPGEARAVALALWAAAHGVTSLLLSFPDFDWPPTEQLVSGLGDLMAWGFLAR